MNSKPINKIINPYFALNNCFHINLATRTGPCGDRNKSDFPEGDANPYRNAVRANMTTNRFYHGEVSQLLSLIKIFTISMEICSFNI